jgi:hypothetical protein
MKERDKAIQLVSTMVTSSITYESAKQCALIAVDEILNQEQAMEYHGLQPFIDVEYWKEVKHEIIKL